MGLFCKFSDQEVLFHESGFSTFPVLHISHDLRYFVLIVGNYGVEDAEPSQFIQVYSLPPEVSSTVQDEDTANEESDDMTPTIISSSQPFTSALKAQYQTSSAPPMANPSILPGDTHLDASDILHIFQPCLEGQGAYVARFLIQVDDQNNRSQIKLTYRTFIATNLVCRSEWSALSRHEGSGPRGFFHAGERLSNGDVIEELFRYRLPIENEGGRSALVSKMQILNRDNIWGNIPLAFAYDDASGRICQSTWGHIDEGLVYGLTIVDMV
ncbi:hypothetical protein ONZ45_g13702 [Pleurotus djamor]|nr:hypothetical protein ONZ45_g13702 [Pleurotus djamor]